MGRPGRGRVPVLLKIAPDLTFAQVDSVIAAVAGFGLDGIIATNTTIARPGFFSGVAEAGGLSGPPLRGHVGVVVAPACFVLVYIFVIIIIVVVSIIVVVLVQNR